jgi:hypothetical protein
MALEMRGVSALTTIRWLSRAPCHPAKSRTTISLVMSGASTLSSVGASSSRTNLTTASSKLASVAPTYIAFSLFAALGDKA